MEESGVMKTTNLLPVRTADGRLCYASYADDAEKARILTWAKENKAVTGPAALVAGPGLLRNLG